MDKKFNKGDPKSLRDTFGSLPKQAYDKMTSVNKVSGFVYGALLLWGAWGVMEGRDLSARERFVQEISTCGGVRDIMKRTQCALENLPFNQQVKVCSGGKTDDGKPTTCGTIPNVAFTKLECENPEECGNTPHYRFEALSPDFGTTQFASTVNWQNTPSTSEICLQEDEQHMKFCFLPEGGDDGIEFRISMGVDTKTGEEYRGRRLYRLIDSDMNRVYTSAINTFQKASSSLARDPESVSYQVRFPNES